MTNLIKQNDEIIEAEVEATPANMQIMPFGCKGSAIGSVIQPTNRIEPVLFIGGPCDGMLIKVPIDGRLYDWHTDAVSPDNEVFRYIPAVVTFDGITKLVYVLFNRVCDLGLTCLSEEIRKDRTRLEQAQQQRLSNG